MLRPRLGHSLLQASQCHLAGLFVLGRGHVRTSESPDPSNSETKEGLQYRDGPVLAKQSGTGPSARHNTTSARPEQKQKEDLEPASSLMVPGYIRGVH